MLEELTQLDSLAFKATDDLVQILLVFIPVASVITVVQEIVINKFAITENDVICVLKVRQSRHLNFSVIEEDPRYD